MLGMYLFTEILTTSEQSVGINRDRETPCSQPTSSLQFSSVTQSCPTLCDPMNRSMPGLPAHHQLLESTQTQVHRVNYAIQPSHPLSSPSLPALNLSQHQGLFKWVSSLHQVPKVLDMIICLFKITAFGREKNETEIN